MQFWRSGLVHDIGKSSGEALEPLILHFCGVQIIGGVCLHASHFRAVRIVSAQPNRGHFGSGKLINT